MIYLDNYMNHMMNCVCGLYFCLGTQALQMKCVSRDPFSL